mmetsp:Transcript_2955/g.6039  ORF Transcript_2955/g.6039 Transcript_2955/m.6039 type:complete len:255 (-) Transcript_2955:82-846(-)
MCAPHPRCLPKSDQKDANAIHHFRPLAHQWAPPLRSTMDTQTSSVWFKSCSFCHKDPTVRFIQKHFFRYEEPTLNFSNSSHPHSSLISCVASFRLERRSNDQTELNKQHLSSSYSSLWTLQQMKRRGTPQAMVPCCLQCIFLFTKLSLSLVGAFFLHVGGEHLSHRHSLSQQNARTDTAFSFLQCFRWSSDTYPQSINSLGKKEGRRKNGYCLPTRCWSTVGCSAAKPTAPPLSLAHSRSASLELSPRPSCGAH